jgi:glycosyltransferase involved in cell wall biosynthesis
MKILVNALGVRDSGGITVLRKVLNEAATNETCCLDVFLFKNTNTIELFSEFCKMLNITFVFVKNKSLINRVLFENLHFSNYSRINKVDLIYNFSGTAQFFTNTKQLVKVHNLLFYSKKLDKTYTQEKKYIDWIKHIFIKRIFFKLMLKISRNIEIQSDHVKDNLSDFIDISKKTFFIKNDFDVDDGSFSSVKKYDFSKKITFIYIVGPHFYMLHKNMKDFIDAMSKLNKTDFDFDIKITLTQKELEKSDLWNNELNKKTEFLGYISKNDIDNLFENNTILISTSIIETLGLHVIEAISKGILAIVPEEKYSLSVYGMDVFKYPLFCMDALLDVINTVSLLNNNQINAIIIKNQEYLIQNENQKNKNIFDSFHKCLKD